MSRFTQLPKTKPQQSYAPFGVVSPRSQKKNKKIPQDSLGPGSYDISLPIISPIIQTIRKKNNNVIVKLSHIGTSSFQGEGSRFHSPIKDQTIGPAKYSPQKFTEDNTKRPIPRKNAVKELKKLIKSQRKSPATIPEVKKIQIEQYVEMPDSKQDEERKKRQRVKRTRRNEFKGVCWSVMKEERIKYPKDAFPKIGPGYYEVEGPKQRQHCQSEHYPSSSFRSENVRSFFDLIRFETSHQKTALRREEQKYKSESLGPGSYQIGDFVGKKQLQTSPFLSSRNK